MLEAVADDPDGEGDRISLDRGARVSIVEVFSRYWALYNEELFLLIWVFDMAEVIIGRDEGYY